MVKNQNNYKSPMVRMSIRVCCHMNSKISQLLSYFQISLSCLPYHRAHFTPPSAKYLILDDFHFCIDPQIINYNGLSFHTSMGLPESGRVVARRSPSPGAQPRPGGLGGGGPALARAAAARPHRLSRHNSDS